MIKILTHRRDFRQLLLALLVMCPPIVVPTAMLAQEPEIAGRAGSARDSVIADGRAATQGSPQDDGSPATEIEQDEADEPSSTVIELSLAELSEITELSGVWLEVTPLRGQGAAELFVLGTLRVLSGSTLLGEPSAGEDAAGELEKPIRIEPKVPRGPAMVCVGADGYGTRCERRFIHRALDADEAVRLTLTGVSTEELILGVPLATGTSAIARVIQDGFAVPDTRISLVPVELVAERPFTLPMGRLGGETAGLYRSVVTDDNGELEIPPIAAGDFMLEAHLPTGQIHRVGPITFAEPPDAVDGEGRDDELPLDLGEIQVPAGLSLQARVTDHDSVPIKGASVAARQGYDPLQWRQLRTETDADGTAKLSGLSVEQSVVVTCSAQGYELRQMEFELLPVVVDCELPALARVKGTVTAADAEIDLLSRQDGEPVLDAALARIAVSASRPPSDRPEQGMIADSTGEFELGGLAPGDWRLTFAAAGFKSRIEDISLVAGQQLDLGLIYLPAAEAIRGRVVAEETGEPIEGASVRIVEPWGAGTDISDAEGRFSLTADDDQTLLVELSTEDRPAMRVAWSPRQQTDEQVVELARGGWIRVLVTADGGGCAGCPLHIVPPSSVRRHGGPVPELETDAGGEALSVALPPGGYYVQLPRFDVRGTSVVETRDADQRFVKVRAGEITTVRFDARNDDNEVRIRLRPVDRIGRGGVSVRTATRRQRAIAEGDGVFRVRKDPGRALEVFLLRWNEQTQFEDTIYVGPLTPRTGPAIGSGTALAAEFQTPPTEPAEIQAMELSSSVVTGRLETFSGQRVAGVRIRLQDVAGNRLLAEARSNDEGVFRVEDMAPGVYSLLIGERAYQFVSILRGRTVDLGAFQLVPGAY